MIAARLLARLGVAALAASTLALVPPASASRSTPSPSPAESRSTTAEPIPPGETSASAGGVSVRSGDTRSAVGEDITVAAGQTVDSSVTCVHGRATIDGTVNGDVVVVAGTLVVRGTVNGDVVGVATECTIAPGAAIQGDLVNVGGSLSKTGAEIRGQIVNIPLGLNLGPWRGWWPHVGGFGLWKVLAWIKLFLLFLFFVCALLLVALVPARIRLISEETPVRFFGALVFGLLGYLVYVFVQAFLIVTVIGIPLAFLVYVVFLILKWMAMCGIFHHIGARLGRGLGREMSLLGGVLLGFLPFALLRFLPFCVGWTIWFAVEILAVGYLIVTRAGTHRGVDLLPRAPRPPAAPAPPGPEPHVAG